LKSKIDLNQSTSPAQNTICARLLDSSFLGLKKGLYSFWQLCTIMVPVYVIVSLLKSTPILAMIGRLFEPLMKYFGLPGGAALALVTGNFVNIYAALAIVASLEMNVRQVTLIALILGVSHSQIMESAIIGRMKAKSYIVTPARIIFAMIIGIIMNLILPA